MAKTLLYFLGFSALIVLVAGVLWPHTMPTSNSTLPHTQTVLLQEEDADVQEEELVFTSQAPEIADDDVVITGTFLSLVDGETDRRKTFKYMLLDDGSEIMRIDLRPLLGYSDIDVIEKLGVERGAYVQVVGSMDTSEFKVRSITPTVLQ